MALRPFAPWLVMIVGALLLVRGASHLPASASGLLALPATSYEAGHAFGLLSGSALLIAGGLCLMLRAWRRYPQE